MRASCREREAMQHPRRNEVYRDVGSELHDPDDPEFIESSASRSNRMRRCCSAATG